MSDDYLIGYSANVLERTFRLYSNTGKMKEIVCDSANEFLNIVSFMENTLKKEDWFEAKSIEIVENVEE